MQLWYGTAVQHMKKTRLERIQYEAARIVTGLTRSVSIDKLIKELDGCYYQIGVCSKGCAYV